MKKNNSIKAMIFLVIVIIISGYVWDFSNIKVRGDAQQSMQDQAVAAVTAGGMEQDRRVLFWLPRQFK